MKKKVRVQPMRYQEHPGVLIQTPFDLEFIRAFKAMVPFNERYWNEHRAGWWCSKSYADVAVHLAHEHFGGAEIIDERGQKTVITAAGERCRQGELL